MGDVAVEANGGRSQLVASAASQTSRARSRSSVLRSTRQWPPVGTEQPAVEADVAFECGEGGPEVRQRWPMCSATASKTRPIAAKSSGLARSTRFSRTPSTW